MFFLIIPIKILAGICVIQNNDKIIALCASVPRANFAWLPMKNAIPISVPAEIIIPNARQRMRPLEESFVFGTFTSSFGRTTGAGNFIFNANNAKTT